MELYLAGVHSVFSFHITLLNQGAPAVPEAVPGTGNKEVTRGKRREDLLQIVHPRTSSKNFKMLSDLSQDHMSLSISYHCAVVHPVSRLRIVNN